MSNQVKILEMKARLRRIAEKNNDDFKVKIEVSEKGYYIEIVETADGHTLADGSGETLRAAIKDLWKHMPHALKAWGYKDCP